MRNRRRNIIVLLVLLALLLGVAVVLFRPYGGKDGFDEVEEKEKRELSAQTESAYKAVPSDAVLIFDFEEQNHFMPLLADTSTFAYGLIDPASPLVKLQMRLERLGAGSCHSVFSLHYSAINEVSLLQILDLGMSQDRGLVSSHLDSIAVSRRAFNNSFILKMPDGLNVALAGDFLLASSSSICLESSLRHLAGGTSILDNQDFYPVLQSTGGGECLYINHKQIGKLFSGSVTYSFLKYSDFVMRMASWSALDINPRQKNFISFEGVLEHNSDFINFSAVLSGVKSNVSHAQEVLPASTIFAVSAWWATSMNG